MVRRDLLRAHDQQRRASAHAYRHLATCSDCRAYRAALGSAREQIVAALGPIQVLGAIATFLSGLGGGGATAKAATDPEAAAKVAEAQAKAKAKYRALYFRPGDLKSELQIPLGVTVPAGAPNADTITKAEEEDINQRVRSNLFTWEQNPQTGALLMHPLR